MILEKVHDFKKKLQSALNVSRAQERHQLDYGSSIRLPTMVTIFDCNPIVSFSGFGDLISGIRFIVYRVQSPHYNQPSLAIHCIIDIPKSI